jgi:hypothetical protein
MWPEIMLFLDKHDVRDSKGRVVNGVGLITWVIPEGVRVSVHTLLPGPGAPNTFLMSRPEAMSLLRTELIVEFSLRLGASRPLAELDFLGMAPLTVTFN